MTVRIGPRLRGAIACLGSLGLVGCGGGGLDDSHFRENPGTPSADIPATPAEYDAKFPVPNSGDAPKAKKARGATVTEP